MQNRIVLTAEQVDRIAARHLAALVRVVLEGLEEAGAADMETGAWCQRFLTQYDGGVAAEVMAGRRPGRRAGDRHLRSVEAS